MFWKKWENLIWLKENIESIQEELNKQNNLNIKLQVPTFELISSEIFDKYFTFTSKWKFDFKDDNSCIEYEDYIVDLSKKYYQKNLVVRSSAIYSEDWEITWAWVYDSVILTKNEDDKKIWDLRFSNNLKDKVIYSSNEYNNAFKMAIYLVFRSIVSEKAIDYRNYNNIPNESMWLIIQEYVLRDNIGYDYNYYNTKYQWYAQIDSILKNNPNYLRIIWWDDWVMVIDKEKIGDSFFDEINSIFNRTKKYNYWWKINNINKWLFPYDMYKMPPIIWIVLMKIWYELEKKFWKEVQIELWFKSDNFKEVMKELDDKDEYNKIDIKLNITIDFFQIRQLPWNYKIKKEVIFPNKEPIFEWYCFSIWDFILDNINYKIDNKEKSVYDIKYENWVYTYLNSYWASDRNENELLPKSWAIIILNSVWISFWHIETLCAEKDILCVFAKEWVDDWDLSNFKNRWWLDETNVKRQDIYEKLRNEKKLHVVSNWFIWKVYIEN